MSWKVLNSKLKRLSVLITATFVILIAINAYYLVTSEKDSILSGAWFRGLLLLEIAGLGALFGLIGAILFFVRKNVMLPVENITKIYDNIGTTLGRGNISCPRGGELGQIASTFGEMAADLEKSYKSIDDQTHELQEKNWELQEANFELEASYGQLQALIEQLNEAEQKYHSLIRNIPEVVCAMDNSGEISFVNHICVTVLGYQKEELVGTNFMDLVDRNAIEISPEQINDSLKDKTSITVELTLIRKDKTTIVAEANFTNHVINGQVMGLQAIIRDITENRQMHEKIIQSNKELAIINSMSKLMTSTLDLGRLSELIVQEITGTLKYPVCVLAFLDNGGTQLYAKAYSGVWFNDIKDTNDFGLISINDPLISRVLGKNKPIKVKYLPEGWGVERIIRNTAGAGKLKELFIVPIIVKDKKIGVLFIGAGTRIKPNVQSLLSSIANNAAVAIDNALLYETSKKYFIRTIDTLIAAVEAKDKYTEGHSQRVSKYAVLIAEKLGFSKEQTEDIKVAGILHDIGKIGIKDDILTKPGKLTSDEYEIIKQHPAISNKILYPVGFSDRTIKAIAFHHERFDGKGYPFGLAGENISLEAHIIAVADAYDAMTSNRSYRKAMGHRAAMQEILSNKATQFHPRVVDAFVDALNNNPTIEL